MDKLHIRTPTVEALCLNLSGGNQQKVVLAKWMNARAHILIFDHPTRGLDVGAKEEVYELIRELSEEGVAIILTADTLEETIGLCHSILVMRDGQVTARFDASPGQQTVPNRSDSTHGISAMTSHQTTTKSLRTSRHHPCRYSDFPVAGIGYPDRSVAPELF